VDLSEARSLQALASMVSTPSSASLCRANRAQLAWSRIAGHLGAATRRDMNCQANEIATRFIGTAATKAAAQSMLEA
jgi:hypothetical protein